MYDTSVRIQNGSRVSMEKHIIAVTLLGILWGCGGTPQSVKTLSTAQLENIKLYCVEVGGAIQVFKDYFERYKNEKLKVFDARHQKNVNDQTKIIQIDSKEQKWDTVKTAAETAKKITDLESQNNADKQKLQQRVDSLNASLDKLVHNCSELARGQAKLDEYHQMETTNDAINELLVQTLGDDASKLEEEVKKLTDKMSEMGGKL